MFSTLKSGFLATLLVLAATSVHCQQPSHNDVLRSADLNLMQFMTRSSGISHENPQRSLSCFDYYVPLLNGITAEYERSYAACVAAADGNRQEIDEATKPQRNEIESSAQAACNALSACNGNENSIPYFECYENVGSQNSKVMYGISTNSSSILAQIREDYRLVENEQNRCTNASERAYVENTSAAYEELQSCLQGKTPVPTPTPSTTTTTEAPETNPPETEPPVETTVNPEDNSNNAPRIANFRQKRAVALEDFRATYLV